MFGGSYADNLDDDVRDWPLAVGDGVAFEWELGRSTDLVYRFGRRRIGDVDPAEEIVSHVSVEAWRHHRPRIRGGAQDDGLSQERHDVPREGVMASVGTEQSAPQQQSTIRSRNGYRLRPVLASVAPVA